MSINLDTEIVGSTFDQQTRVCTYTIARGSKRWTVPVHIDVLDKHGPFPGSGEKRRTHLRNLLEQAMQGPHDAEIV